jgi:3-dehydroquinate synthase
MLRNRFDRSCAVIALGGGVVGDVAGFVASTFMRGIPVVQIPTTLLAQIDSSIGGKTAVNTPLGKNLIGSFHQPSLVLIDPRTLASLPKRARLDGVAEIIKHGIIQSRAMFKDLEKSIAKVVSAKGRYPMGRLIAQNCRIKARVVMKDEKEGGLRRILNFGHTVGHAVETLEKGRLTHGQCVAIGMIAETRIAEAMGLLKERETQAICALIKRSGLPVRVPQKLSAARIVNRTKSDKKSTSGTVAYSLPDRIGNCLHGVVVEDATVRKAIEASR